jgi:hypothetical protein
MEYRGLGAEVLPFRNAVSWRGYLLVAMGNVRLDVTCLFLERKVQPQKYG